MSVPHRARGPLHRAAALRTVLLALVALALALAGPAAAATAPAVPPAVTAEAETAECAGDGGTRPASRRELPAPLTPRDREPPVPRVLPPAPYAADVHVPAASPSRTTVLRC
ncbi:hypothetical protein [Streptomyces indicus]|uniref:Secreted protein n=1 Tax=Streptomyces indicus TaxID=417292 RepID=A0A1G9JIK9_9ACTN|nr:hypothetical protein [Streptomyces indicus]SDL37379.1 hypothetical protein SAMN05421806_13132 [Streptomyces indicus]